MSDREWLGGFVGAVISRAYGVVGRGQGYQNLPDLWQDGRDTQIRIHGTIEPNSIGKSVSNGCLRMVNAHVIDLYNRVPLGTPVTVY